MRANDVELLHIIHTLCLRDSLSSHYTQQHIDAWTGAHGLQSYRDALDEGDHFLVAEMQGQIAGYASWGNGELTSTFVVPAAQGLGVGTLLVDSCTLDATTNGTPILRVRATLNAIDFYRGLGFFSAEPGFHEKNNVRIPYQLMVRSRR